MYLTSPASFGSPPPTHILWVVLLVGVTTSCTSAPTPPIVAHAPPEEPVAAGAKWPRPLASNSCGGVLPLQAAPGELCDACSSWRCAGVDDLECVRHLGPGCEAFVEDSLAAGLTPNPSGVGFWGSGVAFGDVDLDGHIDLLRAGAGQVLAYRGDGLGGFVDATSTFGLDGLPISHSVVLADFDADGFLDLVGTNYPFYGGQVVLRGGMSGFGVAEDLGANAPAFVTDATWGDYDGDGDLDLYLSQHASGLDNRIYENVAGTLVDVTAGTNIGNPGGMTFQVAWFDYDLDGDPDLLVCNDKASSGAVANTLYRNDGAGSFSDVSTAAGIDYPIDCMGIGVGDYDADGDFDFYVTNVNGTPVFGVNNLLFQNQGDGTFIERATSAGVGVGRLSWGARWLDFDNDSHLDLLVTADNEVGGPALALFANQGDGTFVDVTMEMGLPHTGSAYGAAVGDPDRDGDLDVAVAAYDPNASLRYYRNLGNDGHWLEVRLVGAAMNPGAVGASVHASLEDGRVLSRLREAGGMYMSTADPVLHFGLGSIAVVPILEVLWPDGAVTVLEEVAADQVIEVTR